MKINKTVVAKGTEFEVCLDYEPPVPAHISSNPDDQEPPDPGYCYVMEVFIPALFPETNLAEILPSDFLALLINLVLTQEP